MSQTQKVQDDKLINLSQIIPNQHDHVMQLKQHKNTSQENTWQNIY